MTRKEEIAHRLAQTRSRTLWLLEKVPDDFLRRRVHSFYSPVGWHFGHIGRTEEHWIICKALGQEPTSSALDFIFEDRPDNPKDNRINIPGREGLVDYLEQTRARSLEALASAELDCSDPFLQDGYAWEFALQHECQHQETIAEMLQLIRKELGPTTFEPLPLQAAPDMTMIEVPSGQFCMGSDHLHDYDNEKDPHQVQLKSYLLAESPVTAAHWMEFIDDRGYTRPELWSPEGWAWKEMEQASAPEFWFQVNRDWGYYGAFAVRPVHPLEPVSSISWFEAQAYAQWAGKRLPTEQEWEFAAAGPERRRFPWGNSQPNRELACHGLEGQRPIGSYPEGATKLGHLDTAGGVWEWTSSQFLPYPGFRAFPYEGYSATHMDGRHYVCRGGSWATSPGILRCSFRNWYVPSYRQGFLGLRLAEDLP